MFGILPINLFPNNLSFCKDVSSRIDSGVVPVNALFVNSRDSRLVSFKKKSSLMLPLKVLLETSTCTISTGKMSLISPLSSFSLAKL